VGCGWYSSNYLNVGGSWVIFAKIGGSSVICRISITIYSTCNLGGAAIR
jgi:hypothetical protein